MLIRYATVFVDGRFQENRDLRILGGRIAALGERLAPFPGEEVLDCSGDYVIPGFVDVHIHAFRGYDAMRGEADIRAMARELRKEGVAAFLPTTMSASVEETRGVMAAVHRIHGDQRRRFGDIPKGPEAGLPSEGSGLCPEEALIPGAHMEAPFLNARKAGAQRKECFLDPDWDTFLSLTDGHPEEARIMTLAPEKPGSEAFIRRATEGGTVISVGHTEATAEETHLAADWGADHITHTFNAQTPLNHRNPGVPGAALTDDRFFTEMICDGVHLHRDTVRLLWKAKGADKAVVITDAMEAAGMPDGEYALGGQPVLVRDGEARLENGTLAGSVLLMRVALENLIHRFGIPPADAVRMCTQTPADSIRETGLGRIYPGAPAPVTRWNRNWRYVESLG